MGPIFEDQNRVIYFDQFLGQNRPKMGDFGPKIGHLADFGLVVQAQGPKLGFWGHGLI